MEKVNLQAKFDAIHDHWVPRVVGELNGQHVKVAKIQGEYVWHHHADEDEMFLVNAGQLVLELPDRKVTLGPGEFFVVPRGVEHRPIAKEVVEVVLFEPATTRNTGQVENDYTIEAEDLERI